jgi:tRNA(Ile)-lysidine synthase
VLVAVSGGVDSMVLLSILHSLAVKGEWALSVAHFNHQLRGRSSDLDEKLVRQTAEALKLPVSVGRADVKALAQKSRLSLEMAARKLRHEFLAKVARDGGIATIALAHHADDQVELFFLRLLRGAGGEGLAGMKWISPSPMDKGIALIRPLLDVPKTALEEFAREVGIKFRADATNRSLAVPRNRVRNELLPLLRAHYQPGLTKTVLRVMKIVGAEADLVGDQAVQWLAGSPIRFADLPVAVQRRVIQGQLPELGLPVDFDLVEQLRRSADTTVSVGLNLTVARDAAARVKLLEKPAAVEFRDDELPVNISGRAGELTFAGIKMQWKLVKIGKFAPMAPKPGREVFDADRIGPSVVLRHWRPGDRFQPLGMKSAIKLQDLFTNAKIPRERRRKLLVATARGEIFWVEGLRIAEGFKITEGTKRGLFWHWTTAS